MPDERPGGAGPRQRARTDAGPAEASAPDTEPFGRTGDDGACLDLSNPSLVLPSLLEGVCASDPATARSAGHAIVLLAREHDDAVGDVAAGLVERVADGETATAVLRTLATLDDRDEEAVQRPLVSTFGRDRARQVYRAVRDAEPWTLPDSLATDLAAVEDPATTYATDFRQVVRPDTEAPAPGAADPETVTVQARAGEEPAADTGTASAGRTDAGATANPGTSRASQSDAGATAGSDSGAPVSSDAAPTGPRERQSEDSATPAAGTSPPPDAAGDVADSALFTAVRLRSGFDDLEPLGPARRRRYGVVVRARGVVDGEEHGVALRLFHRPEAGRDAADAALVEALSDWASQGGADGVVSVHDWGEEPRPWVVTEYVDQPLATADRPSVERSLAGARRLTAALVRAHGNDVLHGGIDPRNVVFSAASLEPDRDPMLDSVGVVPAILPHRGAGDVLDPRYAAPEHHGDEAAGGVDHATDIYGLGQVLYRLWTGRHPGRGQAGHGPDRTPAPGEVVPALPDALDEVWARATATRKLTRYETATRLHRDVRRVHEREAD